MTKGCAEPVLKLASARTTDRVSDAFGSSPAAHPALLMVQNGCCLQWQHVTTPYSRPDPAADAQAAWPPPGHGVSQGTRAVCWSRCSVSMLTAASALFTFERGALSLPHEAAVATHYQPVLDSCRLHVFFCPDSLRRSAASLSALTRAWLVLHSLDASELVESGDTHCLLEVDDHVLGSATAS